MIFLNKIKEFKKEGCALYYASSKEYYLKIAGDNIAHPVTVKNVDEVTAEDLLKQVTN